MSRQRQSAYWPRILWSVGPRAGQATAPTNWGRWRSKRRRKNEPAPILLAPSPPPPSPPTQLRHRSSTARRQEAAILASYGTRDAQWLARVLQPRPLEGRL